MKMLTYHHYRANPYFNMAFDEWMLLKVLCEKSLICLRLYSWLVGTITIGYNQQEQKAYDHSKIQKTPVIRRVTGGRGLFHDESELTYSIAISADLIDGKVISKSISEASAEIAIILVQFLKQLHISSDYVRKSSQSEREKIFFHQAPCFASFSKNEIVSQNQKIIASAQRRVAGALLQHGSIKINGIKHHDALALNNVKYVELNEIEKLTHSGFESCLPLFFTTFSNVFSAEVRKGLLSENEKISLKKRETAVRNKSLEKRGLIKQNEY